MDIFRLNKHTAARNATQVIAQDIGTISVSLVGVTGNVEDTSGALSSQAALLETISTHLDHISRQSRSSITKSNESRQIAQDAQDTAQETSERMSRVLAMTTTLSRSVLDIGGRLSEVEARLKKVQELSHEIDKIAQKSSLLSLNAAVEAARAGESGLGFRVVASEFKSLSEFTATATEEVTTALTDLTQEIRKLIECTSTSVETANTLEIDTQGIDEHVHSIPQVLSSVVQNQETIGTVSREINDAVERINADTYALAEDVKRSAIAIQTAGMDLDRMRAMSEKIIRETTRLGVRTDDSDFVDHVTSIAKRISDAFSKGIASGQIDMQDLFDRSYVEIPNTDPVQYETQYTHFLDKVLPPIQEAALEISDRVVFCAAVDVNGYLPTHNIKFSHPQRPDDPEWNAAHARNRRIFNDRVGLAAGQNTDAFLLQAYRRDMGNGDFKLMKDLSAPIIVNGRHWGGVRLAYSV